MNISTYRKVAIITFVASLLACVNSFGQTTESSSNKSKNNPFSPSPKPRVRIENSEKAPKNENAATESSDKNLSNPTIAQTNLEIAKRATAKSASPTDTYLVGVGDVLFVSLLNAPRDSTYYTVLNDGTIDYPLAGDLVYVLGLTTDKIEELLNEKIKVYENPQVSVKVREYVSHSIIVRGMVEKAGEKKIQREAIPLYVVRAEANVDSKALNVIIRRANGQSETLALNEPNVHDVLIFPGDVIEFISGASATGSQFYFIGGEITSAGQKDFHSGLTLSQAIIASGGLRKAGSKKATIRRKNEKGMLIPTEYNLKAIRSGKIPDPILEAGDTIEIGN